MKPEAHDEKILRTRRANGHVSVDRGIVST